MASIRSKDNVPRLKCLTNPDGNRLLSDREMNRAFDFVGGIHPGYFLLHAANPIEGSIDLLIHG
jgi:hypothetical protein